MVHDVRARPCTCAAAILLLVWFAWACAPMGTPSGPSEPPAPIRVFDVPTLERLGQAMYAQDLHAAQASDLLTAGRVDGQRERLSTWITEPTSAGERVVWIRRGDSGLEAAYEVVFENGRSPTLSVPQSRQLTGEGIAQHDARLLALSNIRRRCSERYNTVALKDPESDGWLIWALAATTQPGAVIVGGHYRFSISADGHTINRVDALSVSCLTMGRPQAPTGSSLVALVTHLVSESPIETHVYVSMLNRLSMVVLTPPGGQRWFVENARITKSDTPPVESRTPL